MNNDFINHMVDSKRRLAGLDPKDNPWVIKHNGRIVERCETRDAGLQRLIKIQPHSIWEATRKDGWEVKEEPVNEAQQAFHVYLNGKKIDTVFYSESANAEAEDVKRSLVDHDGYDPNIEVKMGPKMFSTDKPGEQVTIPDNESKVSEAIPGEAGESHVYCPQCGHTMMLRNGMWTCTDEQCEYEMLPGKEDDVDGATAAEIEQAHRMGESKVSEAITDDIIGFLRKQWPDDEIVKRVMHDYGTEEGFAREKLAKAKQQINREATDHGLASPIRDESLVSGVAKLLKSIKEKKIEKFWTVTRPSGDSELTDIVFDTTLKDLLQRIKGGLDKDDILGLYDNETEAREFGKRLIDHARKFPKSISDEAKVPDDADPEDTKIKKLTEAAEDQSGIRDDWEDQVLHEFAEDNPDIWQEAMERNLKIEVTESGEVFVHTGGAYPQIYKDYTTLEEYESDRASHTMGNESKLIEQDTDPDKDKRKDDDPAKADKVDKPEKDEKPVGSDSDPVPDEEEPDDSVEKEYIGKTDDTHFYMITKPGESDDAPGDLEIVDQEGNKKWSASEQEIDPGNPTDFIIQAIQDLEIDEITRSVLVKYILPELAEEDEEVPEEMTEEEPEEMGEEPPAGEEEPEEKKPFESRKVNEGYTSDEAISDALDNLLRTLTEQFGMTNSDAYKSIRLVLDESESLDTHESKVNESHKWSIEDLADSFVQTYAETRASESDPNPFVDDNDVKAKLKEWADELVVGKDDAAATMKDIVGSRLEWARLKRAAVDLANDNQLVGDVEREDDFEDEDDFEEDDQSEAKVPDDSDPEDTKIKKLIEMIVKLGDDSFDVELADDGTEDTVISINDKEYRFEKDFADLWRGEDGSISKEGLEELALDALSNMDEEEYNELLAARHVRDQSEDEKEEDRFAASHAQDKETGADGVDKNLDMEEKKKLPDALKKHMFKKGSKKSTAAKTEMKRVGESKVDEKTRCTKKEKRQVKHIEKGEKKAGKSTKRAKDIAHATVMKQKNEAKVNERTTWSDLGWKVDDTYVPPDLAAEFTVQNKAGDRFNIKDANEKFITLENGTQLSVGDDLAWGEEWKLIGPDGDKIDVENPPEGYRKVGESKVNENDATGKVIVTFGENSKTWDSMKALMMSMSGVDPADFPHIINSVMSHNDPNGAVKIEYNGNTATWNPDELSNLVFGGTYKDNPRMIDIMSGKVAESKAIRGLDLLKGLLGM